ncbi:hypothetical protein PGTUg99_013692 [Puccinia graminis f. sp. tritici]|uniref:Uncharacterized protein n=1 Tax=Puccinia graminis f. sp. tritici TaxID=56615 RepID=A0A5B0QH34_PUCGR|nr:hypothetical protein PGTUg99_013692 [Puccinia graminis f. sp. tritici]
MHHLLALRYHFLIIWLLHHLRFPRKAIITQCTIPFTTWMIPIVFVIQWASVRKNILLLRAQMTPTAM